MALRPFPKLKCRAPVDGLRKYVPQQVLGKVPDSSHYQRGSDSVVTTSARTTSANVNSQDCLKKLHGVLENIAKNILAEASRKPPKQL